MNIVEFKTKGLEVALHKLSQMIQLGLNAKPIWEDFIDEYKNYVSENWDQQGRPYGKRWTGLTPNYAAFKRHAGYGSKADLLFKGRLKSAATGGAGWFQKITNKSLTWGIDKSVIPYASVHQLGYPRKNIPARPYMATESGNLPGILYQRLKNIILENIDKARAK